MLGPLLLVLSTALAGPDPAAELVAELLDRARDGSLDAAWLEAHVRPGPLGWTRATREAWGRALAADAPLRLALARAGGIVDVARGQGATRVIVEAAPPLAIVVDEHDTAAIRSIDPTSCTTCDARYRFVSDLLADLRRRGAVFPRLRPGLELDTRATVGSTKEFDASWSASLDAYLAVDAGLLRALSGAIVVGQDGDVVRVRYPDGREDTWRVGWTDDGLAGRIAYDGLAPDSPLRLEGEAVLPWRPDGFEESQGDVAWRPVERSPGGGADRQLGRAAAAAILDPHGDTALVLVLEPEQRLSALFRVAPETGEVLERHAGPTLPDEVALRDGAYPGRALLAIDGTGTRVALTLPDGAYTLDLATGQTQHVDAPGRVNLLGWSEGGALLVGTSDGSLLVDGAARDLPDHGRLLAAWAGEGHVETVDALGVVVRVDATGHVEGVERVCDGDAIAAARRARDGSWLVACGPTSTSSHAIALPLHGGVQAFPGVGAAAGACAWSPEGDHYVVPVPGGGSELWDDHTDRAEARFGREALRAVAFTHDGEDLLGATPAGGVTWWHVALVRKLHWIVRAEAPGE